MNPNNTDIKTILTTVSFQPSDSDFFGYGRSFYLDQSNTSCNSTSAGTSGCEQYKMYIGNANSRDDRRKKIETLQICSYKQIYDPSSGACRSVGANQFTSDAQQETAHA